MGLIMPNKVHGCISHGPEMKPSKRYGQKSPVRGWFGREGKSSTWSASAIPGSCADFLGRSSGGIERYQPCAHTHVITLSWMSVFIQTAPGEFAQLRGGTSTNLVATATSITGRILSQSFHFCPKVTVVPTVFFATLNETTESIAATLEQSALHLFLAANAPASLSIVS